jgi:hypothetical protein
MNFLMKPADDIAATVGLSAEEAHRLFQSMADKAIINSLEKNGKFNHFMEVMQK